MARGLDQRAAWDWIDLFYENLMKGYPVEKLKVWNALRSQMPSWEELHRKYGN